MACSYVSRYFNFVASKSTEDAYEYKNANSFIDILVKKYTHEVIKYIHAYMHIVGKQGTNTTEL